MKQSFYMRYVYPILAIAAITTAAFFILSFDHTSESQTLALQVDQIAVEDIALDVWVADSSLEQRNGLSGKIREDLEDEGIDGMLFVFEEPSVQKFWMKNMLFDLDVVWIQGRTVMMVHEEIPIYDPVRDCEGDACFTHMSSYPHMVDLVLELPAGSVQMYEIEVGDILTR